MAPPRAGALVGGRYRLKAPLAAGGMGAVWLASHVDLETEVAIKLVSRAYAKRADLLERFRREARSAAQLKTPHVVQILDYGVDDGAPYIAMELLDGEDLEALLERESALSPARTLAIVKPICKALAVAHAAGIVHRDLKPSNIFLARIADEEVVKIVDFGIAKELKRDAEYATGSQVLGSPLFMSPEQVARSGAVDARTDLWSLTVLIHVLIFGAPPFDGDGIAALLVAIATAPLTPPSARNAELAPLDAFFAKGLARSPEERFADVAALASALEAAVARLPRPDVVLPTGRQGATTVVEDASWPLAVGAISENGDAEATQALASHPPSTGPFSDVGLDTDATRVAQVASSTQLSFSSPGSDLSQPSLVPSPPRQTARPMTEASSRSATPILAVGALAALAAVAVFFVTSGDDPQAASGAEPARAPSAHHASGPQPTVPPTAPPTVAPTSETAPTVAASASSVPRADTPSRPDARRPEAESKAASRPQAAPTGDAPSASAPARPSQPATIDPEWGIPVQRP